MGVYSIKEVALMVDIPYSTTLTYLGHYSFDKFRKGNHHLNIAKMVEMFNLVEKYLNNG